MYAVLRRYRFEPHQADELNHKVREVFLPLIREIPGFIGYYWLENGDGSGASLSLFQDRQGAEESSRCAVDFVRGNFEGHVEPPDIVEGYVMAHG